MERTVTPEALAVALGAAALPAAPEGTFERAMARYEAGETRLFDPDFYSELHTVYGCFPRWLDAFRAAAVAVAANEPLARYACYLAEALADREHAPALCKSFFYPVSPTGRADPAYDMVTVLPIAAMVPFVAAQYEKRGITGEVAKESLRFADNGVNEYFRRNGVAGFRLFEWFQLSLDAKLFRVGRLEIEVGRTFHAHARVFRDEEGELAVLAHGVTVHPSGRVLGSAGFTDPEGSFEANVEETEDSYTGYPVDGAGLVVNTPATLPKTAWVPAVEEGEPILNLHIPPSDSFRPEEVEATFAEIRAFLAAHFPEIRCRVWFCDSWMLDPQLANLLPPSSNILHFGRRFLLLPAKSSGNAPYYFIFLRNKGDRPPLDSLPDTTSLHRAVKAWYRAGKYIYEVPGFSFVND